MKLVAILMGLAMLTACSNPHVAGYDAKYNSTAGTLTKITYKSACTYAHQQYRYLNAFGSNWSRVAEKNMEAGMQFLVEEYGFTARDIADIKNGQLRLGQRTDVAVCATGAKLVNKSGGHGWTSKQFQYGDFRFFYEENNSGVVDAYN